jgi:hypothetical protein
LIDQLYFNIMGTIDTDRMTNHINNWLGSITLTGNSSVDTIILTAVIFRINTVIQYIMSIIQLIGSFIFHNVQEYLVSRTCGTIVCDICIPQVSTLYIDIDDVIFKDEIESDNIKNKINIVNFHEYFDKMKVVDKNTVRQVFVGLEYNDTDIFSYHNTTGDTYKETKSFVHNGFCYILTKYLPYDKTQEDHDTNVNGKINIKMITFGGNISAMRNNTSDNIKSIQQFLKERFDINNKITYVYAINATDPVLKGHIQSLVSNGMKNPIHGELKYGDNITDFDLGENDVIGPHLNVELKTTDVNDIMNSDLDMIQIHEFKANKHNKTINYIIDRYINRDAMVVDIDRCNLYGYFKNGDIIYVFTMTGSSCTIRMISKGKLLTEEEIIGNIKYLIKLGIENKPKIVVKKRAQVSRKSVQLHRRENGDWKSSTLKKKTFDTIYLPSDTLTKVHNEFCDFIGMEKFFSKVEVPYRRCMLLYGPPGTGKTSLALALAYHYQMDIWTFNLNDPEINDDSIVTLLNLISSSNRKILLFEDIDSAFANKEKIKIETRNGENGDGNDLLPTKDGGYLTYSGLLNALDGVSSIHTGVFTIMTTNYKEKLGDAILRPGRVDIIMQLYECNYEQIESMMRKLINDMLSIKREIIASKKEADADDEEDIKVLEKYEEGNLRSSISDFANIMVNREGKSGIRPCYLQQYIFSNIRNIDDIFTNVTNLVKDYPPPLIKS